MIVPTMFDRRTQASVVSLRKIRHQHGMDTWPSKIPIDTRLRDASLAGVPPNIYDAKSNGLVAYNSLYNWLLEDQKQETSSSWGKFHRPSSTQVAR